MMEKIPIDGKHGRLPRSFSRSPTFAVWISCFFALMLFALNLVLGSIDVARGVFNRALPTVPEGLTPLFDPLYAGLLTVVFACLLGWCQWAAVRYRSAVRSYLAGALYLVWGVLMCMVPWEPEWNVLHYVLAGTILFVGIAMTRWGRQLAVR